MTVQRSYHDLLAQRALLSKASQQFPGGSSFYSRPTPDLDPALFPRTSDVMYPEVRRWILTTLYTYWDRVYQFPHEWSTVWVAGSGVTYQWSGGRAIGDQPGDLDVLIGVDWDGFRAMNPRMAEASDADIAEVMNDQFHAELWPQTARAVLPMGGTPFEVTWFVNSEATDIRAINPYAAYDVSTDSWTVHPREMAEDWDPRLVYPKQWFDQIDHEGTDVEELRATFAQLQDEVRGQFQGGSLTPQGVNTATRIHDVLQRGHGMWDELHGSRRVAFSPEGHGYDDFYNVRWQDSKEHGWGSNLKELASLDNEIHDGYWGQCHGSTDPHHLLLTAVLASQHG